MNEDFVSFDLAKKLKEKGFREKCLAFYTSTKSFYYNNTHECSDVEDLLECCNESEEYDDIDAPTISQVLKWLREKNIILAINPSYFKGDYCFGWDCDIWVNANYSHRCVSDNSYEEAAIAGISWVLDNLI